MVFGAVVPRAIDAVDLDEVLENVDLDALLARIDVDALIARIDELNRAVARLNGQGGRGAAKTTRPAAKKAPAKKRSTARKSAA